MSRRSGADRRRRGLIGLIFGLLLLLLAGCSGSERGSTDVAGGPSGIERDSVRIVFWPGHEGRAERTLRAALSPLPLPGMQGQVIAASGTVMLAPSPAVFDSLTGGRAPHWAAGVAFPAQGLIVLPAYSRPGPDDPVVTLRHELAHLALTNFLGQRAPRWFDEGYATWVSGGWDESSGWQIRLALMRGNAPMLDSLTLAWPREEGSARLAYLLSASAVRHLATSRSEQAFTAFMQVWREGGSFDGAMRSVYQMTPTQFEREWRGMVRQRYGWMLALSQTAVFWLGIAVLVLVLGTLRRQRNRERMEALRREEYMLPPAGGTGDELDGYLNPE